MTMSPHFILFINALLYVLLFLIIYRKHKVGGLAKLSVLIYAGMAIGTYVFSLRGAYDIEGLRVWPFLVYFISFLPLVYPLSRLTSISQRFTINNTKNANIIASGYLICCALQIILSFSNAINTIRSGNYLSVYLHREDFVFYSNIFEQIIINVVNYFFIPIVAYGFYIFARNIEYRFKWWLLVIPFLTIALNAISYASRTDLFYLVLVYGSLFFIFRKELPIGFSKSIAKVGIIFSLVSIIGITVISSSRFNSLSREEWLPYYLGESNITAHDTFVYTTQYSEGTHFFRGLSRAIEKPTIPTICLKDHGFGFRPLISCRFSDFGPLGLIVYVLVCSSLMNSFASKKRVSWGALYILLFYYKTLAIGAFYESTIDIAWIYVVIVSLIINGFTKISNNA